MKLDVHFINPFIEATKNAIETQANSPIEVGKPSAKTEQTLDGIEIAGVIGISTGQFRGRIALCFPAPVFLEIYSGMMGEAHSTITHEMTDAAGELLNIIYGQAKSALVSQGLHVNQAIPKVLRGVEIKQLAYLKGIILPFKLRAGSFHLEIVVDSA